VGKHKELLMKYNNECLNRKYLQDYQERVQAMKEEQDRLAATNLKLKDKVAKLCDVIRLSWDEHAEKMAEADAII
jgi:predicted nuclease with TOPRIM domain